MATMPPSVACRIAHAVLCASSACNSILSHHRRIMMQPRSSSGLMVGSENSEHVHRLNETGPAHHAFNTMRRNATTNSLGMLLNAKRRKSRTT